MTRINYKTVHNMAERENGNVNTECTMEAENDVCHEEVALLRTIILSASSVVRRTWRVHSGTDTQQVQLCGELGEYIVVQILSKFSCAENLEST